MGNIKQIFAEARKCTRCYMGKPIYVPYPDPNNSQSIADIMFINERPGRIGTGESGYVSFDNNDPSANFFKECFFQLKMDRKSIFITNACLCHPNYEGYTDKAPTIREIKNCHYWLDLQLSVVKPKLIITIGGTALKSLQLYFLSSQQLQGFRLTDNIGEVIQDTTPWIYPLFHTSLRGRIHRPARYQKQDWRKIPIILEQLN